MGAAGSGRRVGDVDGVVVLRMVLETGIVEFTNADELDDDGLTEHIRSHLDDADVLPRLRGESGQGSCSDVLDEVPALSAGFSLDLDGRCLMPPGCCSDLGVLSDWREAVGQRSTTPAMLWVGHPWLLVATGPDDRLSLSGPTESSRGPADHLLTVGRTALRRAVDAATADRARFARRVTDVCAELAGEPLAVPLTRTLLADAD
ncbi:hypothetical protein [Actinomadura oligospora]|uniref:hypothetical protein n=1 Tax=Actinomadura oligospora TaxID=111804 RepID=UPI0004B37E11|nr:hypothetical protein [Actinomadura oligospora]